MKMKIWNYRSACLVVKVGVILAILACAIWTSCAVRSQAVAVEEPPHPSTRGLQAGEVKLPEYRLGYGDVIDVKFFNAAQFNESVTVRPDGRISLQRVGDIDVVGMTPTELDEIVTKTYRKILVDPDVTIIVREFGGQQVYVMGEVEHPGSYPVARGMTLLRAVAAAGGPKVGANLKSVIVMHGLSDKRVKASRVDVSFDALQKNPSRDLMVSAYDMIYVPKTFVSDLNAFVSQIYDVVLPPLDVYTRYKYWYSR